MEIKIKNLQIKVPLNHNQIKAQIKAILLKEKIKDANLCFVFVGHQTIRAFNRKFLKRNYATDVLAFESEFDHWIKRKNQAIAGDIVISTDAALKNHKEFKTTVSEELALYIIHGILHLIGYDDHNKKDILKMRKKECELMDVLGDKVQKIITVNVSRG